MTMTSAAGQAFRSSSRATLGALGSKSQSINNISVRLTGTCANVVAQSAALPTTSIFRSSSSRRRAERSLGLASAKYTRVIDSSYNKPSPATSIGRGTFVSATWGRYGGGSQVTRRLRSASVTASVRLATPNLDRMLLTCDLTVDGLTVRLPAICVLFSPSIIGVRTSRSRSVRSRPGAGG